MGLYGILNVSTKPNIQGGCVDVDVEVGWVVGIKNKPLHLLLNKLLRFLFFIAGPPSSSSGRRWQESASKVDRI